ncbi:GNAT family N-acetyltransferase, partial [Methylobacterium trifolii]
GGLGLGGHLLDAVEAEAARHGCTRLRLEVRADNGAGIRLYERRGYTRFMVREDYYEDGMEAWRYEKSLADAASGAEAPAARQRPRGRG